MVSLLTNRRFYNALSVLVVAVCVIGLVLFPAQAIESARESVSLCFNVILPSLFPFFVLALMSVELGVANYAGRLMQGVMRPLFNVGGACSAAFIMGIIGGYPVGAKTAITLYEKGMCSKTEAERLLAFCNNSGPAFILGIVGVGIFASGAAGLLLYLSHIAASVIVGIIFRFYGRGKADTAATRPQRGQVVKFTAVFTSSVKSAFMSTLTICAFVIFFSVAIRMMFLFGIIPAIAHSLALLLEPFGMTGEYAENLLTGLVEVSSGLWNLQDAAGLLQGKLAMAAFMLGWAGLSVHCQVLSFIGESGLSTRTYIAGKLLHAALSAGIVYIVAELFEFNIPVSFLLADQVSSIARLDMGSAFWISLAVSVGIVLFILFTVILNAAKKHWKRL